MRQASSIGSLQEKWAAISPNRLRQLKTIAIILSLTVFYFVSSKLGFLMAVEAEQVTTVWPPTGIALAAVLLFGPRVWPGIWLGAFLTNFTAHEPITTALCIAIGNTLEALTAAWMLHRFTGFNNRLSRVKDIVGLVVFAAFISTAMSATIGVTSLCLSGLQPWEAYDPLWQRWWLGDATGALLFAPPFLIWGSGAPPAKSQRNLAESMALIMGVTLTSVGIFTGSVTLGIITAHAFIYLIFPFVIWAAIRFGQQGTTLITLIAAIIATWATIHNVGPFTIVPPEQSYALLQIFLAVMSVTGLLLSAATVERSEAEKERAQLAAIVASSDDAIIGEDLSAIITFWNRGAERLFGYSSKEAIGKPISLIFPPGREGEEFELIQRLQRGEHMNAHETIRRTKDGRNLNVSLAFSPIRDDKGQTVGVSKLARNITERKETERAMKEADRRKDEFLAVLAHELRNPLAPLSNAIHVLQMQDVDEDRRARSYDIMKHQLQHIVRLVDDLIDVSRISHGKVELRKKPMMLKDAVMSAAETVKPLIEAKKHTLSIRQPEEPLWLNADLARLSQVFANLLNNAAKYTATGGYIWLDVKAQDESVMIRVRDTGIGIPEHLLPRVFDMFMQADHSIERVHEGLGIGLTLVKNFVELHGGKIEAHSRGVSCGSEFVVWLPLIPPPRVVMPEALIEKQRETSSSRRLKVLVVDDHKTLAETLGWMVELLEHDVQLAYDGTTALDIAHVFHPDVVLLDIGLSGMNGYEVCQRMRADPALKNCVIVAQTGWSQTEHRQRSKAAGFNHHIVKPIHIETLEELFASVSTPVTIN